MKLDKIIESIVALGVPGLILLVAINTSGYIGAAAITASLSAIGLGLGMIAGISVLALSVLISKAIAKYGFEKIYTETIKGLIKKGESKKSILSKINKYPISRELKLKLEELLRTH